MKIFPFANCYECTERVKLNRGGDRLMLSVGKETCVVDTDVLRDGSSTLVLYGNSGMAALYNFREICQALQLTASALPKTFHTIGVMQVDKCGGDAFVKVFMPTGQLTLDSDTDDYSESRYRAPAEIHALDLDFSYRADNVRAWLNGGQVIVTLDFHQSKFWKRNVYISHGGQYELLHEGANAVVFKYNPTEDAYIGERNSRYLGRVIPLKGLLDDT